MPAAVAGFSSGSSAAAPGTFNPSIRSAGRSNYTNTPYSIISPPSPHTYSPAGSTTRLNNSSNNYSTTSSLATLPSSTSDYDHRAGSQAFPQRKSSKKPPRLNTKMTSLPNGTPSSSARSVAARIHKRGGSGSSPLDTPSSVNGGFPTPFATYEEPFPELSSTPPSASTPKIKPYLRKMSGAKEDQGKIDLSKPTAENERLAGLGIQDFGPRSVSEVSFNRTERRQPSHSRTVSGSSHASAGSSSYKPSAAFVHPLRQTPRPYTPPLGHSSASSTQDEEASERDDIIEDEFKLGHGIRTRRSMSVNSNQQFAPTPLSQSHTVDDLGLVPKLTSASQTNLSIKSGKSGKSLKSKFGRPRRSTNNSFDNATSPSSRTSFDRAISLVSKRSDTEPLSRDERIRAARRKFEEKEAGKDRKVEKQTRKRQEVEETRTAKREERERRKSEVSERAAFARSRATSSVGDSSNSARSITGRRRKDAASNEKLDGRSYDDYLPAPEASLPVYGREAGFSEKRQLTALPQTASAAEKSGWLRFSTWMQTRMLSCGDTR